MHCLGAIVAVASLCVGVRGAVVGDSRTWEVPPNASLDFDGDGHPELLLAASGQLPPFSASVTPATGSDLRFAGALSPGDQVDSTRSFSLSQLTASAPTPDSGTGLDAYWGFRFNSAGAIHYGWAHLDLEAAWVILPDPSIKETYGIIFVRGWGYESDPNTPITVGAVPEPASAALLLVASPALLWRRR